MTTVHDRFRKTPLVPQYLKQSKFLKTLVWFNIDENSNHKFIMTVCNEKVLEHLSLALTAYIFDCQFYFRRKLKCRGIVGKFSEKIKVGIVFLTVW